ncbi:prephenate dehydratase [Candidatus Saccharibacteria bacterium]|nr:prephenate dehydratase [Candidatus Saccharibacteria bacterium]
MTDINKIRQEIDEIDANLLDLLNARAKKALEIKNTDQGKAPIRPEREIDIIRKLKDKNKGPLPSDAVKSIFTQIIATFRDQLQLERPISVSYLGPKGTYSEEAALKLFGSTVNLHPEDSISSVVRAVEAGTSELAVIPIENSTEGAVRETHRLLFNTNSRIVSEVTLPVVHCLLTRERNLSDIKSVYAHPQALGQCKTWLATHLPNVKQIPTSSNSAAAELAYKHISSAAIASKNAAEIYGLDKLEVGINDLPGNKTRFIALGSFPTKPTGNDKTSIICVLNDKPGALHELLGILADASISMTRLESQPHQDGQYAFFIDFLGHKDDVGVKSVLQKLDNLTRTCKILGSYPVEVK